MDARSRQETTDEHFFITCKELTAIARRLLRNCNNPSEREKIRTLMKSIDKELHKE